MISHPSSNCSSQRSVLIGGSGSTGSSLLRTVFNRHAAVFSREELNFFNKEQYFSELVELEEPDLQSELLDEIKNSRLV